MARKFLANAMSAVIYYKVSGLINDFEPSIGHEVIKYF